MSAPPISFSKQVEDVLLTIYDRSSKKPGSDTWNLESSFVAMNRPVSKEYAISVGNQLVKLGYGEMRIRPETVAFTINERGRAAAIDIYEQRRPKTAAERFHAFNWNTWGGVAAVVGAVAAVMAAYFAYLSVPR